MVWLYYFLLIAVDLCGLVLAAFTLPGLWLMLAGAIGFALLTHARFLSWRVVIVLFVFAAASEISDLVLGGAGAKKAGATKWGILGGFVGAILGGIFLGALVPVPILNVVIGLCLGSFIGAASVELLLGQELGPSLRIGLGAAKGKLFGIVGKLVLGMVMFAITLWAAFPGHRHSLKHAPARTTDSIILPSPIVVPPATRP